MECTFTFAEPAGADVCSLDQVTLTNTDQEALDDFLNSSGDEVTTESSLTSGNLSSRHVVIEYKAELFILTKQNQLGKLIQTCQNISMFNVPIQYFTLVVRRVHVVIVDMAVMVILDFS